MKRTAVFTMGTRGDVQPYIFLAQKLQKHDCDAVIGSHPCWRKLVEDAGIEFVPIGPDIDIEKEAAVLGIKAVNVTLQTGMIPQVLKKKMLFDKIFGSLIAKQIAKPYNKIRKHYRLPENMISVGSVPHSWLFDKSKMVIHHAGFGTASAALIYGIPSIPVPHVLDQFGFAQTLYELGTSCEPIDGHKIIENSIINAIRSMNEQYDARLARTKELSEEIQKEHGLEKACQLILNVIQQ